LWLTKLGEPPRSYLIAALYVFAACGAAWVFGILGLRDANRRQRALTLATLLPMLFLALYQEPHRAIANFPWAFLIPAAIYVEPLPTPLTAAILIVNALFTIRMAATVSWIPRVPLLLVVIAGLVAAAVYWRRRRAVAVVRTPEASPAAFAPAVRWVAVAAAAGLIVVTTSMASRLFAAPMVVEQVTGSETDPVVVANDDGAIPGLAVSGDGERMVFTGTAPASSVRQLWLRTTGSKTAAPLAGTEGATAPFWSPDDRQIGFFAGGALKTIDLETRGVRVVAEAPGGQSGSWGGQTILFAADPPDVLHRVDAGGGAVTNATRPDPARPGRAHRAPAFLPDGDHFFYVSRDETGNDRQLLIGSLASMMATGATTATLFLDGSSAAVFAEPQFVFYEWDRELWAISFERGRFQRFGLPARISRRVAIAPNLDRLALSASRTTLAFAPSRATSGHPASITVVRQWRRGLRSFDSP
jgi:hypothetical protein